MKNDIESYYARLEQEEAQSGKDLSADEIRQLVRTTIANSLQVDSSEVKDNTDFFTLGLDSLMAISVRRTLTKEVNTSGKVLSSNIVFEHPTVDALTSFLVGLRGGVEVQQRPVQEVMQGLIDKYSTFKQHVPKDVTVDGEYIVSILHFVYKFQQANSRKGPHWSHWVTRSPHSGNPGSKAGRQAGLLLRPSCNSFRRT